MDDIHIAIESETINPACVRFIYRQEQLPGLQKYLLSIKNERIDEEMLLYAQLSAVDRPTECRRSGFA
jgi:hypothetical protein